MENQIDLNAINTKWHSPNIRLKMASIKNNRDEAEKKFDISKISNSAIREQYLNVTRE